MNEKKSKITLIVFSGNLDKVLAALNIASGAITLGMEVTIFFTFWGLNVLRKPKVNSKIRGAIKRMMRRINRGGVDALPLSRFNMGGIGTSLMKKLMKDDRMQGVEDMLKYVKDNGGKFIACTVTMGIMGLTEEDLRSDIISGYAGVIQYISEAKDSNINLFI